MRRTRTNLCSLALLALLLAACGDDAPPPGGDPDGGADAGAAPLPEDAYCLMLFRACERQIECGAPVLNTEGTLAACYAATQCEEILPSMLAAGAVLRDDDIATCTGAVVDASCEALVTARFPAIAPACETPYEGAGDEGAPCSGGVISECQVGLRCDLGDGCPGVCASEAALTCHEGSCPDGEYCDALAACVPLPTEGEACEWPSFEHPWERTCAAGSYCGADGLCVPSVAAGESCPFGEVFVCVDGQSCIDGTCVEARAIGEECNTYSHCAADLYCDFDAGACAARRTEGEACGDDLGTCDAGLTCHPGGTCEVGPAPEPAPEPRPVAAPGGDCREGVAICPLGTTCTCADEDCAAQTCQAAPDLGDDCSDAAMLSFDLHVCAAGVCDLFGSYRCVQPGAAGAPCESEGASPTLTLACLSLVCEQDVCLSFEEATCEATP